MLWRYVSDVLVRQLSFGQTLMKPKKPATEALFPELAVLLTIAALLNIAEQRCCVCH